MKGLQNLVPATDGRCAIYVRVSSPAQEDGSSLDTQEAACRAYAAEHGYDVAQVYREVYSGVELWDRPQLSALRDAIRQREVGVVVAYAIDRLARDPVHLGVLLSEADHAGVDVRFVTEALDDSPEGQLIRFVRGYAAKVEHLKILERTQRGKRARVASGRLMPANVPLYGYEWDDPAPGAKSRYVEHPATAAIVRRIFREAASGRTLRAIAQGLTADGVPNRQGEAKAWSYVSVRKVIQHPAYKGEAWANRWQQCNRRTNTKDVRPPEEWIALPAGTIEPLVDAGVWQVANDRLERNRRESPRNNPIPERYLLRAGFVTCGLCGWAATAWRSKARPGGSQWEGLYYKCAHGTHEPGACPVFTIAAEPLDAAVWQHAVAILTRDDVLAEKVQQAAGAESVASDLATLDRALHETRASIAKLTQALAKAPESIQDRILAELETHAAQERTLQRERGVVLERQDQRAALLERVTALRDQVRAKLQHPDDVSYEQKRLALEGLGIRVRIWPRGYEPRYEVTMPPDNDAILFPVSCHRSARG
jgi:site-specific DNA recombinase